MVRGMRSFCALEGRSRDVGVKAPNHYGLESANPDLQSVFKKPCGGLQHGLHAGRSSRLSGKSQRNMKGCLGTFIALSLLLFAFSTFVLAIRLRPPG